MERPTNNILLRVVWLFVLGFTVHVFGAWFILLALAVDFRFKIRGTDWQ